MQNKPQEFVVTLRIVTDPNARKTAVTEAAIKKMLKRSFDANKVDDVIETIRVTDAIDVTK